MTLPRQHPEATKVEGSTFVIVANGYAEGPSQPLERFLVERGAASVTTLTHPLVRSGPREHRVEVATDGSRRQVRSRRLPNHPPLTYLFDPLVPLVPPRADVWFGFNCLATAQGLVHRRLGRVQRVVHWNIDFVPDRFGTGVLTQIYDRLDAHCCRASDGRVELSTAARDGRIERYGLGDAVPDEIIPMGAWTADSPKARPDNLGDRRVVFLGSLVERMGVDVMIEAVARLRDSGRPVVADIVGGGRLLDEVRAHVDGAGLDELVTVHGFVEKFDTVRMILARAAIALAPYEPDPSSFSRFADPGKLKAYLAAGLPILLTDVPPNARDLVLHGGAEIVPSDAGAFAARIDALLSDPVSWRARHEAASAHALTFDWTTLFDTHLPGLGLVT